MDKKLRELQSLMRGLCCFQTGNWKAEGERLSLEMAVVRSREVRTFVVPQMFVVGHLMTSTSYGKSTLRQVCGVCISANTQSGILPI